MPAALVIWIIQAFWSILELTEFIEAVSRFSRYVHKLDAYFVFEVCIGAGDPAHFSPCTDDAKGVFQKDFQVDCLFDRQKIFGGDFDAALWNVFTEGIAERFTAGLVFNIGKFEADFFAHSYSFVLSPLFQIKTSFLASIS